VTALIQRWLRANPGQGLAAAFGELEVRVLESLWRRRKPASVREVREDYPEAAYTTLMTTLDRLYRKSVLDRERAGRAFLYRPRYSRSELEALLTANVLEAFLVHDPSALRPALSFLVDAFGTRDQALLDELEALVRERRGREEQETRERKP
jgi:predicted transcriptional regulator